MNSSLPISVPIRALGLALAEALGRESHGLAYNALSAAAEGLIEVGGSREQLVQLLSGRLGFILSGGGDDKAGLALNLGIRALQTGDKDALLMVRIAVGDNIKNGNDFRRGLASISSQVSANAMWLDYFKAKAMWDWYWETTAGDAYRSWFALRIGGAALLAGVASVATEIAFALRDSNADFDAMKGWAQDPAYSSTEKLQSDLSGRYLGQDPEVAMVQFLDFAKGAVAASTGHQVPPVPATI